MSLSISIPRLLRAGAFLLYCVVVVEALLWGAAELVPSIEKRLANQAGEPVFLVHPEIGRVGNPRYRWNDVRGFRNSEALDRAEIVTLGDSQTWGQGAPPFEGWPHHLSRMLPAKVYNMGMIDTGPGYYHYLVDEALKLDPEWVLTGFYFGNDLWNVLHELYLLRLPGMANATSIDPAKVERVKQRSEIIARETGEHLDRRLPKGRIASENVSQGFDPVDFVRNYSKTWGALRAIREGMKNRFGKTRSVPANPSNVEGPVEVSPDDWRLLLEHSSGDPGVVVYETETVKTLLDPGYRILGEDIFADSLVREGLDLSLEMIRKIDQVVRSQDRNHMVVLIPSKEFVFWGALDQSAYEGSAIERLARNEEYIRELTHDYLNAHGIPYVDALPKMREAVNDGVQIYPPSVESHPNYLGYAEIARAVAGGLQERGFDSRQ